MVVILDEPTVGLDPIQIRDIRALIKELGGEHSVILSTHILPEVEMVCDQVQIIHQGKLVFNGGIEILKQQRHGNKLVLGLKKPPAQSTLLKIPGVTSIDKLPDGLLRVRYAEGQSPVDELVQTAVNKGWGLFQISPDQTSLEEVFVQLTFQEAA
jgi:ABC-2 type transport system ATP-binding protein